MRFCGNTHSTFTMRSLKLLSWQCHDHRTFSVFYAFFFVVVALLFLNQHDFMWCSARFDFVYRCRCFVWLFSFEFLILSANFQPYNLDVSTHMRTINLFYGFIFIYQIKTVDVLIKIQILLIKFNILFDYTKFSPGFLFFSFWVSVLLSMSLGINWCWWKFSCFFCNWWWYISWCWNSKKKKMFLHDQHFSTINWLCLKMIVYKLNKSWGVHGSRRCYSSILHTQNPYVKWKNDKIRLKIVFDYLFFFRFNSTHVKLCIYIVVSFRLSKEYLFLYAVFVFFYSMFASKSIQCFISN